MKQQNKQFSISLDPLGQVFQSEPSWAKQIGSKQQHSEVTDLVSTGVEEVPQTDNVAVV